MVSMGAAVLFCIMSSTQQHSTQATVLALDSRGVGAVAEAAPASPLIVLWHGLAGHKDSTKLCKVCSAQALGRVQLLVDLWARWTQGRYTQRSETEQKDLDNVCTVVM